MSDDGHKVLITCCSDQPCTFRSNTGDLRCLKEEIIIGSDGTCSVVAINKGRLADKILVRIPME